jgi:hypothetical protein
MNIPIDLIVMCLADIDPSSEEGTLLLPPQEVVIAVREYAANKELTPFLEGWLTEQTRIAADAAELIALLPLFKGDELPGWMGSNWAIRLGCPWGAGLSDAVREGRAWLASQ